MLPPPHPFAPFVRALGRGKSLTRSLTLEEAEQAMAMILAGEVLPEQLGAFLMLLRVKEETGDEIAGFTRAVRAALAPASGGVDLDWPCYAGKKRVSPWHLLAALALAGAGWRIALHGLDGHTEGRLYAGETLARLGLPPARDLAEAREQLASQRFAYLSLERLSAPLARLLWLKPILGLRSPINTLARGLNPFGAPASMQAVFHPGYVAVHRDAALALGDARALIFRGDGGENERRPNKPCETTLVAGGAVIEARWPATLDPRQTDEESPTPERLAALWRGEANEYGEAAVLGTLALALYALGAEPEPAAAEARARAIWESRARGRLA